MSLRRYIITTIKNLPLLLVAIFITIGQLIGFVLGDNAWFAGLLFLLLSPRYFAAIPTAIGLFSVVINNFDFPNVKNFEQNAPYIGIVGSHQRQRKIGEKEFSFRVIGRLEKDDNDGYKIVASEGMPVKFLCKGKMLPWHNLAGVEAGDVIVVQGQFHIVNRYSLLGYNGYLRRRGFVGTCKVKYATKPLYRDFSWIYQLKKHIEGIVIDKIGDNEKAGLVLSMSNGTRDLITERTEQVYKKAGLAHILVVSGYQVSLIFFSVLSLVQGILTSIRRVPLLVSVPIISRFVALIASTIFVLLVGSEGPSLRAGLVVIFCALGFLFGRRLSLLQGIVASFCIMTIIFPGVVFDPSVQLSYAALLGLWWGMRGDSMFGVRAYLRSCFFASLFTSIVGAIWFHGLSIGGFILNPILAPLLSLLGCKAVFAGIILVALGIDQNGILLKGLAYILNEITGFLAWITSNSIAYVTGWSWIILSIIAIIMCERALSKINIPYGLRKSRKGKLLKWR